MADLILPPGLLNISDFEREVILEALSEYVERGTVQAPLRTAAGELHARRIAAARDLTLRLS